MVNITAGIESVIETSQAADGAELMVNRHEAGAVWAKSMLRDWIDAVVADEDAESLTGDHDFAEAMAPETTLPITDRARHILRAIRGKPRER